MSSHPLVAAVLSALVPGAGQLYARKPRRALAFFLPSLVVFVGVYRLSAQGSVEVASLLVRPSFLSGVLAINVLVFIWRMAAAIDAYLVTDSPLDRSWMAIPLGLVLLVVAVPHLIGWSYGVKTISALESVFVAAPAGEIQPLDATTTPAFGALPDPLIFRDRVIPDARSVKNYILRPGIGDPDAIAARGNIYSPPTPIAPFTPLTERVNLDRFTVLLVGADAGPGRTGLRTDTMIVATVNTTTGDVALFGLPRNLKLVPLPGHLRTAFVGLEENVIEKDLTDEDEDGYPDVWIDTDGDGIPEEPEFESCACFPTMLNKVHQYTRTWTGSYPNTPDPGLAALSDIVSHLIGLPIDHYVMVKMEGFVKTIDALGGVDVLVKEPYHVMVSSPGEGVEKAKINVEPGMNHLDGLESLAYVRWRIGSSDYHRMARQRCMIRAVADQSNQVKLVTAFPALLDVFQESVVTDIPLSFLPDLVKLAARVDTANVATVGLVPPTYSAGRTPGKYPIPNVQRIRWKVRDVLENGVTAQSRSGLSECA
jgi:LCP family protein required for cell wall assembly